MTNSIVAYLSGFITCLGLSVTALGIFLHRQEKQTPTTSNINHNPEGENHETSRRENY